MKQDKRRLLHTRDKAKTHREMAHCELSKCAVNLTFDLYTSGFAKCAVNMTFDLYTSGFAKCAVNMTFDLYTSGFASEC